jgi:hypothetical protein
MVASVEDAQRLLSQGVGVHMLRVQRGDAAHYVVIQPE